MSSVTESVSVSPLCEDVRLRNAFHDSLSDVCNSIMADSVADYIYFVVSSPFPSSVAIPHNAHADSRTTSQ